MNFENDISYLHFRSIDAPRTHQSTLEAMKQSHLLNKQYKGMKGLSPMVSLEHFDLTFGFGIDYMHAILIGVMKLLLKLWFDSSYHEMPFYIGRHIISIQGIIDQMQRPANLTRFLKLSEIKTWKASQLRFFLFFVGYPVLKNYLKKQYLTNFLHLSNGVYLLSKESISESDFEKASDSLKNFSKSFQKCYGKSKMYFNVHLVSHLAESVKAQGPLWAYSMFCFENKNGFLGKLLSGTKHVVKELANKNGIVHKFFKNSQNSKHQKINENVFVPNNMKKLKKRPSELEQLEIETSDNIYEAKYFFLKKEFFERENNQKLTCDCFVQLTNDLIGKIKKIFVYSGKIYFLFEKCFIVTKIRCQFLFVRNIQTDFNLYALNDIKQKVIYFKGLNCFSTYPNRVEGD